nr:hypothetical protein [Angustibacter aerolatus]
MTGCPSRPCAASPCCPTCTPCWTRSSGCSPSRRCAPPRLVVVTGDHLWGPQPTEVLQRLTAEGDRLLLLRGNADREVLQMSRGEDVGLADDPVSVWGAQQARPEHQRLLDAMPEHVEPGRRGVRPGAPVPRHAPRRPGGGAGRQPDRALAGGARRAAAGGRDGRLRPHPHAVRASRRRAHRRQPRQRRPALRSPGRALGAAARRRGEPAPHPARPRRAWPARRRPPRRCRTSRRGSTPTSCTRRPTSRRWPCSGRATVAERSRPTAWCDS